MFRAMSISLTSDPSPARENSGFRPHWPFFDRPLLFQTLLPNILSADPDLLLALLGAGNIALYWRCVALCDSLEIHPGAQRPETPPAPDSDCSGSGLAVHARWTRSSPRIRLSSLMIRQAGAHTDDPCAQASALLRRYLQVISLDIVAGGLIDHELWRAIASLPHLEELFIRSPTPHVLHEPSLTCPSQRISPALQLLIPPGLARRPPSPPPNDIEDAIKFRSARIIGAGGYGLGPAWEHLQVLHLEGLDQTGSRNLATHLQMLCNEGSVPTLSHIHLTTHFMDLTLLSAVGRLGSFGNLRRLELGTSGTKVNAECLQLVLKRCTGLEALVLRDVEGRLEKGTWSSIQIWPATLRTLIVEISEYLPHHSWTLQHLQSIHCAPLAQLTTFEVRRVVHPLALLPFPPPMVVVPAPPDTHHSMPLPTDLLERVCRHGDGLSSLVLTWWTMDEDQLLKLLRTISNVERLEISISISMQKLLSSAPSFGTLRALEILVVVSSTEANRLVTGRPHGPDVPRSELESLPEFLAEKLREPDVTIPEMKDMRKLVRRTPTLQRLSWTGRGGKGEWIFSHPKKGSSLVSVDFVHSAILTRDKYLQSLTGPPPPPERELHNENTHGGGPIYLQLPNTPRSSPHSVSPALPAESATHAKAQATAPSVVRPMTSPTGAVPSFGRSGLKITSKSSPASEAASPFPQRTTSGSTRSTDKTSSSASSLRRQKQRANPTAFPLSGSTSRTRQAEVSSIFKPDVVIRSQEVPAMEGSRSSGRNASSITSPPPSRGRKSSASRTK